MYPTPKTEPVAGLSLHSHRFWVEAEKRFIKLRISSKGMRIIDKLGIDQVLADIRKRDAKV